MNTVLDEYNKQAECLGRPILDFQQVIEYSFLSNFELLHQTHNNITQQPWAQPLIRNAMISWMKTERAKEEIKRLNVEARRLKTYIRDSSLAQRRSIRLLHQTDPALAAELQEHYDTQSSIGALLSQQLRKMECLSGFTGCRTLGVQAGVVVPGSESDDDGVVGEDPMEDWTVGDADAVVEDAIGDQLFGLDNLVPDPVPSNI